MHPHVVLPEAPLFVGQRPQDQRFDVIDRQRLKFEYLAPADQRR